MNLNVSTGGDNTPPPIQVNEININGAEDSKIKNFCKSIFSANGFKIFAAIVGASTIVVGSLAAKGIIVFASAAGSLLAAKILIPVGCVILVVLLAKLAFDCVSKALSGSHGFSS